MRSRMFAAILCSALFFLAFAASGAAAVPTSAGAPELTVDMTRMLYQCQMRGYDYTVAPGVTDSLKGYRSFEIDANVTNRSNKPVEILLKPARWIITDGTKDVISDLAWEYVSAASTEVDYKWVGDVLKGYAVPRDQITQWQEQGKTVTLQPGQSVGQTFIAFPLDKGEWVKGVDFVFNGQTYHKDFDIGPYGNAYNYGQDCGVWAPGPDTAPTPTPGPAALAMALNAAGVAVTPEALIDQVYLPERKGSLQVEMLASARRHGLMAYELAPELKDVLAEVAAGNAVIVLCATLMFSIALLLLASGRFVLPAFLGSGDAAAVAAVATGLLLLWPAAAYQLFDGLYFGSSFCMRAAGDTRVPAATALAPSLQLVAPKVQTAAPTDDESQAEVRGRDLMTGLPKTVVLTPEEIQRGAAL